MSYRCNQLLNEGTVACADIDISVAFIPDNRRSSHDAWPAGEQLRERRFDRLGATHPRTNLFHPQPDYHKTFSRNRTAGWCEKKRLSKFTNKLTPISERGEDAVLTLRLYLWLRLGRCHRQVCA